MRIDHCLILAAGFGTRMGKIGRELPKVLWPVFEKSLLELQVAYARSLGVENIYINLHFMGEKISNFCKTKSAFEGVHFLWEKPEILDIGGAVHNLAALPGVKYKGKLLILNADQFFYMKKDDLFKILKPYEKYGSALFSYFVNSSLGYNALEIDSSRLVRGIKKNKDLARDLKIETYTGISYIDLAKLTPTSGASSFFESVCALDKNEIPAVRLDNIDYWDFGTLERYWITCFNILKIYRTHSTHPFLRFLVQEKALKTWKINLQEMSYHAKSAKVINLNSDIETDEMCQAIIMSGKHSAVSSTNKIWWNGLVDEVI